MNFSRLAIVTGVLACAIAGAVPAQAAERFSDVICPQATPKVVEFTEMGAQAKINLVDLRNLTHAVVDRYDDCAKQKLSDGYVEPKMHYAQTRAASFLVIAARIEAKIQDYDGAQVDLNRAKDLASEVAEWRPQSSRAADTTSRVRPSYYEESAKEILASLPDVQTMIPKLQVQPTAGNPAPLPPAKP